MKLIESCCSGVGVCIRVTKLPRRSWRSVQYFIYVGINMYPTWKTLLLIKKFYQLLTFLIGNVITPSRPELNFNRCSIGAHA